MAGPHSHHLPSKDDASAPTLRLALRVKPGASRTKVGGTYGAEGHSALVVAVSERAVDGKATEAALKALADALGVPRRDVRLVSGVTSRDKVAEISHPTTAVINRLNALRAG